MNIIRGQVVFFFFFLQGKHSITFNTLGIEKKNTVQVRRRHFQYVHRVERI